MLRVDQLQAFYGGAQVLHGVRFEVRPGEVVALLGRNGAGRSTTAKALMGLVQAHGQVEWKGEPLQGLPPFEIARRGIGYVAESRDIFPRLTVHQNLLLGQQRARHARRTPRWGFEDMYGMFPVLRTRRDTEAGVLSGGEQQVLALCRTLMGDPDLLLVDEPTEGLSPQWVAQVGDFLRTLKARGVSVLLIEQKLSIALEVSDRVLVMGHGRIVFEGSPAMLVADEAVRREWLEV